MNNKILKISKEIIGTIFEHARKALPLESCGYLAGTNNEVTKFYPMTNVDQSHEHFSFDPKEQFSVVKDARNNGLTLLSVYHSHPETPARLSEEDIKLLNDPNMIYTIVSLKESDPDIKGYMLNKPDDKTIEIKRIDLEIN